MRSLPGLPTLRPILVLGGLLAGLAAGPPAPLLAQDADWTLLPAGRLRVGVAGGFAWADKRFTPTQSVGEEPLATDLAVPNAATLFPGVQGLTAALRDIMGDPGYTPTLGATRAYLQASQVTVPFSAEVGVTSWLTLGTTVPLVKSRVEGDIGLLPGAGDDLGVNPAFQRYAQVLAVTQAVAAAAAALPPGESEVWGAWAEGWIQAYAASAVFPVAGTATGDALLAAVDAFNAVLSGASLPPVSAAPPLADERLTNDGLRVLLSDPSAHFQFLPLPTQLLWTVGDVDLNGRILILEGPPRPETGRPSYGVTGLATITLPTGPGGDARALYEMPAGEGVVRLRAGVAGWVRRDRVGLSARVRYGLGRPRVVERRVAPLAVPLVPAPNLAKVQRNPGSTLELEIRPSLTAAPALTLEGFYRFLRRAADRYERVAPLPASPAELIPYPGGLLYADPSVLEAGSEWALHLAGGGLRYHPPQGDFPVEVWANVVVAVTGSGARTLKETRLEFGGRATRRLWGR